MDDLNGSAFGVEACGPVHLDEGLAPEKFSGRAIEHIKHPVAVGEQQDLAWASLQFDVGEDGNLGGIPIELVMWRKLIMPFQFSGIGIKSDQRAAVKVVAQSRASIPVRARIAGSPIGEVGFRIVGARYPDRRTTGLP